MFEYILRLVIMLPLIGGLVWGSLWLWRKTQPGMHLAGSKNERILELIDANMLGNGCKLAVVRYRNRELLIAINRTQTVLLAEDKPGV
jgi:flagellar protein FliO/FliZ